MKNTKLCFMPISDVSGLLASCELSPVELVQAHLDRISETDTELNSFITLLAKESLKAARGAEQEIQKSGITGPAPRRAHRPQGPLLHQWRPHHGRL